MIKPLFFLLFWMLILLSACAPSENVMERVNDAHARNDAPPIWIVKDHDSILYLYGTLHLLPLDLAWQKQDMQDAFDSAGTIFFELDTDDRASIDIVLLTQQLGQYREGQRLSNRLDPYQLKLLEATSHNGNIPYGTLNLMKPWLASEFLTVAAARDAGLSADISADEALKSRAKHSRKNVIFLDSAETQIRASADQPEYVQLALLVDTMEQFNSIGSDLNQLAKAWVKGDMATLGLSAANSLKDKSPELYEKLILDRNTQWAKTLTEFLEDSGTGFVAVGIGHLLGEDSVQTLLRDQGYTVSRHFAYKGEDIIRANELGTINPAKSDDSY